MNSDTRAKFVPKEGSRDTPAMRQYYTFKKRHPECVLFFRMGDFYEMFDEDAVTVHKALGLTLTERTAGVPMAGVPHHSVEVYLRRMIEQGFRVAVCEQVQDPREAKGVVDRAVTRVLTPGTLVDDALLRDEEASNLAAVCFLDDGDAPEGRVAIAVVEVSTGAFTLLECEARAAADELSRRRVREIVYAEIATGGPSDRVKKLLDAAGAPGTPRPAWTFRQREALEALLEQYGVTTLGGFGLADDEPLVSAAGAVMRYLRDTQDLAASPQGEGATSAPSRRALAHLAPPRRESLSGFLAIDGPGLRSLEIERTIRSGQSEGSLLSVFGGSGGSGGCRTAMGKRLLRDWLCRPLAERAPIEARQACVATLVSDRRTLAALAGGVKDVQDVARIAGRLGLGRATPRDLVALGKSLAKVEPIAESISNAPAFVAHREALLSLREALAPIAADIAKRCVDASPAHMREGGLFRDGIDSELDEARLLQRDAASWLAAYQTRLMQEHELPGIKVGFNKVFGYFIELTAVQARKAPMVFTRKQTLKNAERYTTPELKEFEEKVTTAEARAIAREQALFEALCARIARAAPEVSRFAQTVAELDVLCCFAERAARKGWVRPEMVDEPVLEVVQGRHPVLEELLGDSFVPNDITLGAGATPARLALITGPNMAGKSTYIRQAALIAILAHTGSFVPAEKATIGIVDRVFTRIGAEDALHAGQSTFMVEMTETAAILNGATERSLVILDEIGRGTSTLDGLSLAWAIAERLAGGSDEATEGRSDGGKKESASSTSVPHSPNPADEPSRLRLAGSNPSSLRRSVASSLSPRTLFATHYHELTALEERLPGRVANLHVAVREWGEQIVFLHRILPGRTDKSYGIHVAKLAGMPREVVARAGEILESLEVSHTPQDASRVPAPTQRGRRGDERQMGLFMEYVQHPVVEELKKLDLDGLTPRDAVEELRRLSGMSRSAGKADGGR